jgi:GGDEF domain-containing protein
VTLSIGVAFSAAHPGEVDLYKAADRALYVVKERGRNGYAFFDQVAEETAHV